MAIIRNEKQEPLKLTEDLGINACHLLPGEYYFPRFGCSHGGRTYEADLLIISKAGYGTEVEIKLSLADWRKDLEKKKHQCLERLKFFYFAVPENLIDKIPEGFDPRYGILALYWYVSEWSGEGHYRARIVRPARALSNQKIDPAFITGGFKTFYYRFWTERNRRIAAESRLERLKPKTTEQPKKERNPCLY